MNSTNNNTKTQKGFTTTELLIASALAVIVVGAAGLTLSNAKKAELRANMSISMLQEHTLNMQRSRSPEFIRAMLMRRAAPSPLNPSKGGSAIKRGGQDKAAELDVSKGSGGSGGNPEVQPAINAINPDIANCFAGRPPAGGCSQFNGEYTRSWISASECQGAACLIKSQIVIELECSSERCSQVKAHVSSWGEDESWNLKRLSVSSRLPSSIFAAENSVNYGCASSGGVAVFGINGINNVASCNGPALSTACTGGQPLRALASANLSETCHQMASASCAGRSGVSDFRMILDPESHLSPASLCRFPN